MIAFVVGLRAEARLLRGQAVFVGGGDAAGAARAAERAVEAGATGLVSFGLAGGLKPGLPAGALIIPRAVLWRGARYAAAPDLAGPFTCDALWGAEAVVVTRRDKQQACTAHGADAVDLESGAVAALAHKHGLPFAVLRAVCDPAERDLPPAALVALNAQGAIAGLRIFGSVLADPAQIGALLRLAADASRARATLAAYVREAPGLRDALKTDQMMADTRPRR